jgi:hypothetical protein
MLVKISAPLTIVDLIIVGTFAKHGLGLMLIVLFVRNLLAVPVFLSVLRRHVGIGGRALLMAVALPVIATVVMLAAVSGTLELTSSFPPPKQFAFAIPAGVAVYCLVLVAGMELRRKMGLGRLPRIDPP